MSNGRTGHAAASASPPLVAANGSASQRADQRYKLVKPLTGAVESQFERYTGRVLDLSRNGFLLFVPGAEPGLIASAGRDDFGEIMAGERAFGGFGSIVHVRALEDGVEVGFKWDDYVQHREEALIDELIGQLLASRSAGSVVWNGGRMFLAGHVSAALATDVYRAHQAGATSVLLDNCTSIDSGGLDLLLHLQTLGVLVESASAEVWPVLARFHLIE